VIREDRELLTELARLNRELAPLAMRMMEGSASIADQQDYAQRLIAAGERLRRRADGPGVAVIEEEVLTDERLMFPPQTIEPLGSGEYR
jgi:hypothetical protein